VRCGASLGRRATAVGAALAVLLVAVQPRLVRAETPAERARAHYAEGRARFARGDFTGAISEWERADALVPAPLLDFNIALAHEQRGDRAQAVVHYRRYLERDPQTTSRAEVELRIRRLESELRAAPVTGEEPTGPPPVEPPPVEPPPVAPPPVAPAEPASGTSDGPATGSAAPGDEASRPASAPAVADPQLARAAAVDVAAVRDQRGLQPPAALTAPRTSQPAAAAQPAPIGKPVYRQWWFWVVVGVAGIVLINALKNDEDETRTNSARLRGEPSATPSTTPALHWRF
jgi:tetratricopeptide (TPR) repeat protein